MHKSMHMLAVVLAHASVRDGISYQPKLKLIPANHVRPAAGSKYLRLASLTITVPA